jgi:phosphoribosylformimino-5-aminoimidazole carboxamide ribotide isomerase
LRIVSPRIIPVLDVMNSQVVRAVAGRRSEYKPVESKLTVATHPLCVALALLEYTKARELYVADLDAIRGAPAVSPAVERLARELQCELWLDAGLGANRSLGALPDRARPVVGTETATPHELREAAGRAPVVSIDLRGGALLGDWEAWGASHAADALTAARRAVELGAAALVVLDLARVGTGRGTGTEPLLRAVRAEFPSLDVIAGGGVRDWADVDRLGAAGATGVLVASALHDGALTQR